MNLSEVPLILQSSEGREDIITAWKAVTARFWPDLPFGVHVLREGAAAGWSRRLKAFLESLSAPVVFNWLDDQFTKRKAVTSLVCAPLEHLIANDDIGAIYLYTGRQTMGKKEPGLEGFGRYDHVQPYYWWTQNGPLLWKREVMIATCDWVIHHFSEEADRGWTGAYNWELNAGRALIEQGLHVCGPYTEEYAPVEHRNGVVQNKWARGSIPLLREAGFDIDFGERGIYTPDSDDDVYVEKWRRTKRNKR